MSVMPENIILWRHTQAEELFDGTAKLDTAKIDTAQRDMQRALTQKGQRQAADMAMWLKPQLPKATVLQCSPALRAFQTAEALRYKVNINQALKPGASLKLVLASIVQINSCDSLVLVGHQPWLGQLAAHLLGLSMAGNIKELPIKKGAIWWLRLNKIQDKTLDKTKYEAISARYVIHTVQIPSLL